MKSQLMWTAICSAVCSVIATLIFKKMGVDSGGWIGVIGPGLGIAFGTFISVKMGKTKNKDHQARGEVILIKDETLRV